MKKPTLYFITGASGVGKTAIIPYLNQQLASSYEVHDFDERGVPDNADRQWRLDETHYWINFGQQKAEQGITSVVCGGSNPDEIQEMERDFINLKIETILLDGRADIIEQRLRQRNLDESVKKDLERAIGSVDDFIKNNTKFVKTLRAICKKHHCSIIDTSELDPQAVADKVVKLLQ